MVVEAPHDGETMKYANAITADGQRVIAPDPIELTIDLIEDLVLPDEVGLDAASLVESPHLN